MNSAQIENNLQKLIKKFSEATFIYDFLLAYGLPKASIKRLQTGGLNLSKVNGEIDWKKKLFFKEVETDELYSVIDAIKLSKTATKHDPRFVVVTDYKRLLAIDTKTQDSLDIAILDIAKHYDFFLPWAGMEKAQLHTENIADVKAAEKMAKLFDEIKKDNHTKTEEEVHNLNVFLSRLLFCFFSEDTNIFPVKSQFTHAIISHTQEDGSDLNKYLDKLFNVLNTDTKNRKNFPAHLEAFPYVNGGLFKNKHSNPVFTSKSRQALIDSGELNWSGINPDIFGSMIQAVVTPEHRGGLGMHYTSVPNIMKVIEPLFLNELYEEFEVSKGNLKKLKELRTRISKIKIFDPACGSGNFLIIAYKELRNLEIAILKEIQLLSGTSGSGNLNFGQESLSVISLSNFYGIELDDFAHEIAILSLWLAQHQMNQKFKEVFGSTNPTLPLQAGGNVVQGNATRLDWEKVCPNNVGDEIYILGNPPYLGARVQNAKQKSDLDFVFKGFSKYKDLDYIACWFYKGAKFISGNNSKLSFVTTNSICQGDQVALLWPAIFNLKVELAFAHLSFKWTNNAKDKAAVIVAILGLRNINKQPKYIFKSGIKRSVTNINAYLIEGSNTIIERRNKPLSNLPKMPKGNMPYDGGHLLLTREEMEMLIKKNGNAKKFIKKIVGAKEYINDVERYCIWITDEQLEDALEIVEIKERVSLVREARLQSTDDGAKKLALRPHQFREINVTKTQSIIIPLTTSERREYVPIGFINSEIIATNAASVLYNTDTYLFSVIASKMHMIWMQTVAGRLKSDYRYSSDLCYYTFPFPIISENQKKELEMHTYRVLEVREKHSEKTLAQLYDPNKMPHGLREAHHQLDFAVEQCYRSKPFESDEERLEYLFKLYEQMIAEENTKGTLFEIEPKQKKKAKKK